MAGQEMMQAVFLDEVHKMSLREVPVPVPGPGEALVAIKSVGVCGSDIHYYERGGIGSYVVTEPLILGHECAGDVVALGPGVEAPAVGARVAIEPGIPCRRCSHCKGGRYNLCQDVTFMGTPPDHGAFCQYVAWPADFLFELPPHLTTEVGATIEPLAVGLQAVDLVGLKAGESVVVLGAGPIGLLAAGAAFAAGAGSVTAVDVIASRLEFAEKMGACRTVNAAEVDVSHELADSADVVLDCVGAQATVDAAFDVLRPGGRIAWVGMAAAEVQVPMFRAQAKEAFITGVWRYANVYPTAVNLLAAGKLDTEPLITHRFPFPEVEEATKFAAGNKMASLKTMVNFD